MSTKDANAALSGLFGAYASDDEDNKSGSGEEGGGLSPHPPATAGPIKHCASPKGVSILAMCPQTSLLRAVGAQQPVHSNTSAWPLAVNHKGVWYHASTPGVEAR